jgi:thioredoxin 1
MAIPGIPLIATDMTFDRTVLDAGQPVVAVFWSSEDKRQSQLADVLGDVARAYAGEVLVVKLDRSDVPEASRRFRVGRLPQFLFFRAGQPVARVTGIPTAAEVSPWVEYLIGRGPLPAPKSRSAGRDSDKRHVLRISDEDFDVVVLQSKVPVLVDFWAPWCGPCKAVAPLVERIALRFGGRALAATLNVDESPRVARRYRVRSIPSLLYFRDGMLVDRVTGVRPAEELASKMEALL